MEERSSSSSFSQQASQASWIIPFVNLGIMAVGNSAIRSAGPSPIGTLILGCTVALFFIAGIVFGIVGLFGSKKQGAKSTLVPSVVGILLNGVLLSLLLAAVISSFHKARVVGDSTKVTSSIVLSSKDKSCQMTLPAFDKKQSVLKQIVSSFKEKQEGNRASSLERDSRE